MRVEDLKRVSLLESIFRSKEARSKKSDSALGKGEVERMILDETRDRNVLAKEEIDWKGVHLTPTEIYDSRGRILRLGLENVSSLSMVL